MPEITDHKTAGNINEFISIEAVGQASEGGAFTLFRVTAGGRVHEVKFHEGLVQDPRNPNGLSNEVFAAILIHRLKGFQGELASGVNGRPCVENAHALRHFQEGLMWLQKRTRDRQSRGVEGKPAAA